MHVLGSFGGGVDSTTLIAIDLDRERAATYLGITLAELNAVFPRPDAWVFSDPGAEFQQTYDHITRMHNLLGDRLITVRRDGESIREWCLRLGVVPLMPGASHICSLKFKGEVLQKWADAQYGGEPVHWLIGIEADEEGRAKRFQKPRNNANEYSYPLMALGLTREKCLGMLVHLGWEIPHKSSCVFCPFMSEEEIRDLYWHEPEGWAMACEIESAFQAMSREKHQRWIDAGKPLVGSKRPRAPKGMWRLDSWAEGARLFAKRIDGQQLSMSEWAERFEHERRIGDRVMGAKVQHIPLTEV